MHVSLIAGTLERTLQINYRVDVRAIAGFLGPELRPLQVGGHGIAGISFVHVSELRPRFLPGWVGIRCECALHWIAVESARGSSDRCFSVVRCDTDSRLGHVGGGLFGAQGRRGRFEIEESPARVRASVVSHDGSIRASIDADVCAGLPHDSAFRDATEAANVFHRDGRIESLRARSWGDAEALRMLRVHSGFFDDPRRFPPGAAQLDSAVVVRGLRREAEPLGAHAQLSMGLTAAPA